MGSCLSCLGLIRSSQDPENPETARLLSSNDPYRSYNGDRRQMQAHHLPQQDPETLKKDREAFEGICHAMADNVVDVFTAAPNPGNLSSRVQSADQLQIASQAQPSAEEGETPGEEDNADTSLIESKPPIPQEMAYRSVRKMPTGMLSTNMIKGRSETVIDDLG